MNINDINEVAKTNNIWESIFNRQNELMRKYREIELKVMKINELYKDVDYSSIDNEITQLKIKEYLWRISEEIGESYECIQKASDIETVDVHHQLEELGDSLHFLVELMINLGINFDDISPVDVLNHGYTNEYRNWDQYDFYLNAFTGLAKIGNCLKNKPWKMSQIRTDREYMTDCILETLQWITFIFFYNKGDMYEYYMKKSEVNEFRQETNY